MWFKGRDFLRQSLKGWTQFEKCFCYRIVRQHHIVKHELIGKTPALLLFLIFISFFLAWAQRAFVTQQDYAWLSGKTVFTTLTIDGAIYRGAIFWDGHWKSITILKLRFRYHMGQATSYCQIFLQVKTCPPHLFLQSLRELKEHSWLTKISRD